ncbi:MAG TPA: DNA repair protein RadA [Candidatus Cloacimonadota bacterium]|nr:DNA repair protein RadA [Candidatus Cloacimonadales bacterium]HPY96416.1 DNA repair protein RadA [Candidatus Cloacimonadota bacterium]HQB41011.1 DNA repair protein RadA [Candidatus Cloacimonadota bacterium]
MTMFFCKECGFESTKWLGKCPACNSWNTFVETTKLVQKGKKNTHHLTDNKNKAIPLDKVSFDENHSRIASGLNEFDCVLGGGIVPGMVALIGGEPGIGKSTIMLQIAGVLAKDKKILYVSGEESSEQIKLRSIRLGINSENILLLCQNNVEQILQEINNESPDLIIIDSIQAVYLSAIDNLPGSLVQIRETANVLTRMAKQENIPLFFIGHVTKDGAVAGPKILEHMVDTVLYFEGELTNQFKILRTTKNRFGSTNEIGIFEMTDKGLRQVENPSEQFIMNQNNYSGTAISCVLEGSRAFLIEVQALVSPTNYGNAQRVAVGIEQKKLALLLAVIEKNLMLSMRELDIFINFSGGIKVIEPGTDLALIAAILSSFRDKPLREKTVFIGEVGLNGDIRPVSQMEKRIKEALKLGFKEIFTATDIKIKPKNVQLHKVKHISELGPIIFD